MLWQTGPNPCDNHRHAFRKYHRGREREKERERERERERREEKKGLNTHRTKKTARYNSEKRVFTGCVAAVFWWAMGATRLCPSSSWFLILLAKMPFPIPPSLPAYRPPPVCSALRCVDRRCFWSAATDLHACSTAGAASRLMGQIWLWVILYTWKYAAIQRGRDKPRPPPQKK